MTETLALVRDPVRDPLTQAIRLRDGRALGFAQFGPVTGLPVFFFHGGGSTRLTRHPDDSILDAYGVRLITVDRPGVGLSDPHPGRILLDWPDDVVQLADSLDIDLFTVLGWSAGGPHALACAYKIPHRLRTVGVMSGLAPLHWPGLTPLVASLGLRLPASAMSRIWHRIVTPDASPRHATPREIRAVHRQRLRDIVRAREKERARELAMLARPWGFRLQDVTTRVHLWYGSRDATTPLYMAAFLKRALPFATLHVWPNEGHHVGFTHWREIVSALVG